MPHTLSHYVGVVVHDGDGDRIVDRSSHTYSELSMARVIAYAMTEAFKASGFDQIRAIVIVDPATPLNEIGSGDKIG